MSVCFCVQDVEEAIVTLIEGAEWEEALRLVSTVHTLEWTRWRVRWVLDVKGPVSLEGCISAK